MDKNQEFRTWPETAEQERNEIFQYFLPDGALRSASDATLSAFAQLAALRLNSSHALISLLDDTKQHVLVEATRNSRLLPTRPATDEDEGFLLGRTTMARPLGLCGYALDRIEQHESGTADEKLWRPPPVPFMVADVAADETLRSHPFVVSHPSVRFYAAVPICTALRLPVGVLSVLDERPREGLLGADEIEFLDDVGPSIMTHLETATRIRDGHRRGDKMIKGLGVFMEGRMELHDWWSELGDARHRKGSQRRRRRPGGVRTDDDKDDSTIKVEAAPVPRPESEGGGGLQVTGQLLVATPMEYTTAREPSPSEGRAQSPPPSRGQSSRSFGPGAMDGPRPIPKMLSEMLSRAAHIIQEAIDVDGAIFLDARVSTPSERSESLTSSERGPGGSSRSSTNPSESEARGRGGGGEEQAQAQAQALEHEHQDEHEHEQERVQTRVPCRVLSLWTSERSSLHGDGASGLKPVTESFLLALLNRHPQGHIFCPAEAGEEGRRGKEAMAAATLGVMLPGARSIVVVPLWDVSGGRWFAAGCMWTATPTDRVLTRSGDLNYLAAFGNSIMAEVARLDVVRTDLAKSDFISSISHELRSPLHGILASAELLHDTTLDLFQRGMVDTVERCGRTLLDTIQHVLDFAKINNFLKHGSLGNMANLSVDVNLSLLVEDVVDSVFAGHEFQSEGNKASTPFAAADEASGGFPSEALRLRRESSAAAGEGAPSTSGNPLPKVLLDVILDIGWRPNWFFRTESGAVRRVLMNLFGNALKYTDRGWIKVSLRAEDVGATKSTVTITVADSGRGIDPEYLHGDLFTPFTQENPLNPGTGLGLSIVLQIVRSLRGRISITSEPGLGTKVVVTLVLNQVSAPHGHSPTKNHEAIQNARDKAGGLSVGLLGFGPTSPGEVSGRQHAEENVRADREHSTLLLRESIESTVTQWFGMEVTTPSLWPSCPPDIYIANGRAYIHDASPGVPIIALCSHEELHREYRRRTARGERHAASELSHFVSKPYGPHKLAEALNFCLAIASRSSATTSSSAGPRTRKFGSPHNSLFSQTPDSFGTDQNRVQEGYFSGMTAVAETLTEQVVAAATAGGSTSLPVEKAPRLLLVEDNKINLHLLSTFIGRCPFDYTTAENGLEAVQAFGDATPSYDIIIMDISMPIMDGLEATRQIRKLEQARPQKRPAMIIALTGLGSANNQKDAFGSGVDMFLTKPVRLKDLGKILDGWIPNRVV